MALTAPAFAQDIAPQDAAGKSQLDDIVVTARRRSETAQSVPIAISAFSMTSAAAVGKSP